MVHPLTGEVLEHLEQLSPETLADALEAVRDRQRRLKEMGGALEDELRRRLALRGRAMAIFGDFEVAVETGQESVWDCEELELVLRQLIDEGTLSARECVGVVTRAPTVSRSAADRLSKRLTGQAHIAVERCRTWRSKGAGRVRVTKSVPLIGGPDA